MARVFVACERSGKVRRAFAARGHDAWSGDLVPADDGSNRHFVGDARDFLHLGWDLLIVCHPPCTRLCRSGHRWLYGPGKTHPKKLPKGRTWESMIEEFNKAVELFSDFWNAPVPRIAIENPEMHPHAKAAIRNYEPPAQIVQPWWFGDPAFKATGLYLRNLPKLEKRGALTPPEKGTREYLDWAVIHRMPPGPDRARARSETFQGVADAFADQWGCLPPVALTGSQTQQARMTERPIGKQTRGEEARRADRD